MCILIKFLYLLAHDSTKINDETNTGHINPETNNSDSTISFKRSVQFRKHKSLPKKKNCSHKITQTNALPLRDTDVQTELKLMSDNFHEYMASASVESVREEKVSVDGRELKIAGSDNQVAFTSSDGTEDNCILVPLKKRKGYKI